MKVIAVIPTYNEAGNIVPLVRDVLAQTDDIEVLVVDDDSPDGTWRLVEEEGKRSARVHLLRRHEDRGRGLAGLEGFRRALAMGAERVVELDGDFSHDPRHIPALLEASEKADVVIGSRYTRGGRDEERGIWRRVLSALARRYLRWVLGVRVSDPASGYRCFRREALEAVTAEPLGAKGPFIVAEIIFRCSRLGMRIIEVPIVFRERGGGRSKLRPGTLVGYLFRALRLRFQRDRGRRHGGASHP